MLNSFRQLTLDELTEEDLKGIAKVVDLDPETEPQFVYNKLSEGEMVPWRLETTDGNVIITVEIRSRKKDRVLYIWFAAGKGLIKHGKFAFDTLEEFARLNNCAAMETVTIPKFADYALGLGGKITHIFVRKELNQNG
ncbi:hypothetical protein LCGC14_0484050 [marine sediment metagenome]|uniref:Uncharacterized protein n=1 Tax=marine sediment metagenome TaxID=412755 RepID=A0A0F9SDZ0_9ZZZZ